VHKLAVICIKLLGSTVRR